VELLDYGAYLDYCDFCWIHHNNFVVNNDNYTQGCDDLGHRNSWNESSSAGNFWSDYDGEDAGGTATAIRPPPSTAPRMRRTCTR